jgi:hypothetical protein
VCDLRDKRIVGVGVSQHRADRQEYLGNCESWRPLIPQNIQTNTAVAVDVGVVDSGCEVDLQSTMKRRRGAAVLVIRLRLHLVVNRERTCGSASFAGLSCVISRCQIAKIHTFGGLKG